MKVKSPNYVKLLIEKFDSKEQALISKELITTTEKARMNSLVRDLQKYFENKNVWVIAYSKCSLANISVFKYFITDHKELKLYEGRRNNIYYKVKFFDLFKTSLEFNKEKVTQHTANEFIKNWCQESDKGLGSEKELPKHQFYYENENGAFSVCDNSSSDCFCEDFKTEIDAQRYLKGWSLDEIEFGERDNNKSKELKAYEVGTDDHEDGNRLIFAESANKAKSWCIKHNLLECSYIEMHSNRVPEADKYLNISIKNELNWEIPSHQIILIEKLGWQECC